MALTMSVTPQFAHCVYVPGRHENQTVGSGLGFAMRRRGLKQ
jgi:hypothetical protein